MSDNEPKEETDEEYYFGAQKNISKLVAVRYFSFFFLQFVFTYRKAWDSYIVPSGRGSRIPTHFVIPPDREWV